MRGLGSIVQPLLGTVIGNGAIFARGDIVASWPVWLCEEPGDPAVVMRPAADAYWMLWNPDTANPPAFLQISATKAPHQTSVIEIARIRRLGHTCFRGASVAKIHFCFEKH